MEDGFDALYREHRAALTRYARRQVGDGADDIVAATFEIAYTRLRSSHPHPLRRVDEKCLARIAAHLTTRSRVR